MTVRKNQKHLKMIKKIGAKFDIIDAKMFQYEYNDISTVNSLQLIRYTLSSIAMCKMQHAFLCVNQ